MTVRVRTDGMFVTYRFNGWQVTSPRTFESDLKSGCYNDANPSKVTSVSIEIARGAPARRLDLLYSLLSRNGRPSDKVAIRGQK